MVRQSCVLECSVGVEHDMTRFGQGHATLIVLHGSGPLVAWKLSSMKSTALIGTICI